MERSEVCHFCGKSDHEARIVPWFVQMERRSVHMRCFLASYGADTESAPERLAA
jgi:hypothetical protein